MAEGLTVDGSAVDVDEQAFAAAMAAPEPTDPVAEAPKPKDPEAPFGRDAKGKPKAPYGTHPDGRPKRSAGGRKPKDSDRHDRPRVQEAASGPQAGGKAPDYRAGIQQVLTTGWAVLAPFSPADAGAVLNASPALVDAWGALAEHDPRVGKIVAKVTETSVYGAAISATLMLGLQIAVNHGRIRQEAVAGLGVQPPEALAELNGQALQQVAAQQAAQAEAQMAA